MIPELSKKSGKNSLPMLHAITIASGVIFSQQFIPLKTILREIKIVSAEIINATNGGYVSGKESDRRKLFVKEVYPLKRKKDGVQFGYSIITQSIGSGVESRFTIFNRLYDKEPIKKDDIILCSSFTREGSYFTLTGYSHLYN